MAHGLALREAGERVYGVPLEGEVPYAGRTDAAIARDLLTIAGVQDTAIDAGWAEMQAVAADIYARSCPADLSETVAPGILELLTELAARPDEFRLSLVTGNLQRVARVKLASAGIGHYFEDGQGGFGSDAEDRGRLPAIARARAASPPWPRSRTAVIGDTPHDIACARVDEVRVAAVATGPFAVAALADADAVVDDARALLPVLSDWA